MRLYYNSRHYILYDYTVYSISQENTFQEYNGKVKVYVQLGILQLEEQNIT